MASACDRDHDTFPLPAHFKLLSGQQLGPGAFLAYKTFGTLRASADRSLSNAILWVTCYNQRHSEMAPMIAPSRR